MTDRRNDQLRPAAFELGFTEATPGSVLVSTGRTRVLCTGFGRGRSATLVA